ncbi:GspE/PulE family protein [Variovorax sp. PCZ-1]|uniref:GspE/PulE family protein n=1 Tax=Variovorax sp. PCZ-1 TaxID=2835533 RepID=UPI001BCD750E|nr:GspE/PulE family protein [Variovorax sp. PCZ-1]MBS7808489.1 type II/IV secretion system protein [Variovorax sp. PCZ-1]
MNQASPMMSQSQSNASTIKTSHFPSSMVEPALGGPIAMLRQAIGKAFPDRAEIVNVPFEGNLAQAWQAFSSLLATTPLQLTRAVAPFYGVEPAGSLEKFSPEALALVPANFCQQNCILPLRLEERTLVIATANPLDDNVNERARFVVGRPIRWVLGPPGDIEDAIVFAYSKEASRLTQEGDSINRQTMASIDDNAVVKLSRALMVNAIEQRASDLHIQPYMGACVVRIRVDGVLRRLTMLPDAVATSLLRHIKIRSGMEATNTLVPQDGRMSMVINDREFDMRVSCLPASRGERLVIRFLDQSRVHNLSRAGFSHAAIQTMRRGIVRPAGMIIMTGPTGCGKTSTLYGMLAELNKSTVNIITVENPVEYRIPGISQVEVNDKAGRTFMAALRSILRQDPDIVLIGEIRDEETAEIACQAALTGHLVLSTLHTNDALTAIPRLLNLGVQPTILADSLALIIAQRLCRTLCSHCKVPVTDPLSPMERTFLEVTHNRPGHRAVGCKVCNYSGYLGRLPIVDIAEMNSGLRNAVATGESRLTELAKLRDGGLKSLAASGSLRVISGDTTVAEVVEAVGPSFWPELAEHFGTICHTDPIEISTQQIISGQGVLLMAAQNGMLESMRAELQNEGLVLSVAPDAETAHTMLQKDENIAIIIADIPEEATLEQAIQTLQHNRLHISWARLPSAVLLPPALMPYEDQLRDSGVMAEMLYKPLAPNALINFIHQARAR